MAPRRGKKAAATAVVETVTESTESGTTEQPIIIKPTKETKKSKASKNIKPIEENDIEINDKAVEPVKPQTPPKKAASKKNAKQTEQNEVTSKDEILEPAKVEPRSKRTVAKKNYKESEENDFDSENVRPSNGVRENEKKSKGRKKKEESPKIAESKASKSTTKNVEPNPPEEVVEASTSEVDDKKSKRGKAAKNVEAVEVVPETKYKRGAKKIDSPEKSEKKVESPEKPVETEKPTRGRGKKLLNMIVSVAKSATKSSKSKQKEEKAADVDDDDDDVVDENSKADSSKNRKRKQNKTDESPDKKTKEDTVDGPSGSKENGSPKKRKATTRTAADSTTEDVSDELVTKRKKPTKTDAKEKPAKTKMNATETDFSNVNFESDKEFTTKVVSWNVAGLRAVTAKNGLEYFEHEKADIICLQEIKCLEEEVPEEAKLKGYHFYWCSTPGGRGGVAILSKAMPYNIEHNIGDEELDEEGRIITADYSKFYLVCVYVPNAGRKLVNLKRRLRWNKLFEDHVNKLKAKKPVIIVGDMNVAHEEIDLANPKTNRKNAGFSDEERAGMTDLLGHGFIDTFRDLNPDEKKAYTFWSYMGNARTKNVGWRLDYSIVSENLKSKVVDSFIRPQILGSDHCPIVLLMNI